MFRSTNQSRGDCSKVTTGISVTSPPLPTTQHMVSIITPPPVTLHSHNSTTSNDAKHASYYHTSNQLQVPLSSFISSTSGHNGRKLLSHDRFNTTTDNMVNLAIQGGLTSCGTRRVTPEDFALLKVIGKGSYGTYIHPM